MLAFNETCRRYRLLVGATLADIAAESEKANVKNVSAFEHGRSTNINHVTNYYRHAIRTKNENLFLDLMWDLFDG